VLIEKLPTTHGKRAADKDRSLHSIVEEARSCRVIKSTPPAPIWSSVPTRMTARPERSAVNKQGRLTRADRAVSLSRYVFPLSA
jgi:hypothetical protein